jgi:hypothetical protein
VNTRTRPERSRCRHWYALQAGWVHAAGRSRLGCSLLAGHTGWCESVDGWLWQVGAFTEERYPKRRWRCAGRRRGGAQCGKTALVTENGARARGWHIVWVNRRPDAMCPRCAAPAPPPPADRWSLDRA